MQAAFHSKDEGWVKEYMGATGGMRKMLEKSEVVESPAYLSAKVCTADLSVSSH